MISVIAKRHLIATITLFLTLFGAINWLKPSWLYNRDGSIKQFGIGYRNKTIYPIWLFSISLAVICYLIILFAIQCNYKFI